jgi:BirA family biotin operon repressor/biotin-[acetyl-CoA-carboxylase] ligase
MLEPLKARLKTKVIGSRIMHYSSLQSTMEMGRELAGQGAIEGTVIITDEQTAGRGRMGRTWCSGTGSLAMSVILRPETRQLAQILMLTSLAVIRTIQVTSGVAATLKWPNDVLINGKKVCGVLIETNLTGASVDYAVVGIGINVNVDVSKFPEIKEIATSLSHEAGRHIQMLDVAADLITNMDGLYLEVRAGDSMFGPWRDRLETLGKRVRVQTQSGMEEGIADSVDESGTLVLRRADGSLNRITVGDVLF